MREALLAGKTQVSDETVPPGTPSSTGLLRIPYIPVPPGVEYKQTGGFGPVSREEAFDAARKAGSVRHGHPDKIWVQKPAAKDANVEIAIQRLIETGARYEVIETRPQDSVGFGVYYLYERILIIEHTSDEESKIKFKKADVQLPHFHVETLDYGDLANPNKAMAERITDINGFQIFKSGKNGSAPQATRLVRLGQSDPSVKLRKPTFNHHIYYWR